jgi:hypothetical protein
MDLPLLKFSTLVQGAQGFQSSKFIFTAAQTIMVQTVRIDEADPSNTGSIVTEPQDEVRVEAAAVKQADTHPGQIAQNVQLAVPKCWRVIVFLPEATQILEKLLLAPVERRGMDGNMLPPLPTTFP